MIQRSFSIRLPPYESDKMHQLGRGFPRSYSTTVWWPDWREKSDYAELTVNPTSRWDAFTQCIDTWADKKIDSNLFPSVAEHLRQAIQKIGREKRIRNGIAWEFLRRNKGYQRDFANWSDYRELNNITDKEVYFTARQSAGQILRDRYSVEPEFNKPSSPFDGDCPLYTFQLEQAGNSGTLAYRTSYRGPAHQNQVAAPVGPYIDYRIYLNRPIEEQILWLRNEIDRLQTDHDRRYRKLSYINYLRVLDGRDAGASNAEIAAFLYPDPNGNKSVQKAIKAANRLVEHGYRWLAGDPSYSDAP